MLFHHIILFILLFLHNGKATYFSQKISNVKDTQKHRQLLENSRVCIQESTYTHPVIITKILAVIPHDIIVVFTQSTHNTPIEFVCRANATYIYGLTKYVFVIQTCIPTHISAKMGKVFMLEIVLCEI